MNVLVWRSPRLCRNGNIRDIASAWALGCCYNHGNWEQLHGTPDHLQGWNPLEQSTLPEHRTREIHPWVRVQRRRPPRSLELAYFEEEEWYRERGSLIRGGIVTIAQERQKTDMLTTVSDLNELPASMWDQIIVQYYRNDKQIIHSLRRQLGAWWHTVHIL